MESPLKWTCESCGTEIDPHPDCVVEILLDVSHEDEDGNPIEDDGTLHELSEEDKIEAAAEMGVTVEQIEKVLAGGVVEQGAKILCMTCQDEGNF